MLLFQKLRDWKYKTFSDYTLKDYMISFSILFGMLGFLLAINILFFNSNIGFISIHPHPYWIPVLYMSLFYPLNVAFPSLLIIGLFYCGCFYYQSSYNPQLDHQGQAASEWLSQENGPTEQHKKSPNFNAH